MNTFQNPIYYVGDRSQPWQIPATYKAVLETLIDETVDSATQSGSIISKTLNFVGKVGIPGQIVGETIEIVLETDGNTIDLKHNGFVFEQITEIAGGAALPLLLQGVTGLFGVTPSGFLLITVGVVGEIIYSTVLEEAVENHIDDLYQQTDVEFKLLDANGQTLGGVWYKNGLAADNTDDIAITTAIADLLRQHGIEVPGKDVPNPAQYPLALEGMTIQYSLQNDVKEVFTVYDGQIIEDAAALFGLTPSQFIGTSPDKKAFWDNGKDGLEINLYETFGDESWVFARTTDQLNIQFDAPPSPSESFHPSEILNALSGEANFSGGYDISGPEGVEDNLIIGSAGSDVLEGGGGRDFLFGNAGSDNFQTNSLLLGSSYYGGAFSASVEGELDEDTIVYFNNDFQSGLTLNFLDIDNREAIVTQTAGLQFTAENPSLAKTSGDLFARSDRLFSIEQFLLTNQKDIVVFSEMPNYSLTFAGFDGADVLDFSNVNSDIIIDTNFGNAGNVEFSGFFSFLGGTGDDEFYGRVESTKFDGGAGNEDLLSYGFLTSGRLVVDLTDLDLTNPTNSEPIVEKFGVGDEGAIADTVLGIEWFEGTARADIFRGKEGFVGGNFDGFDDAGGRDILDFFKYSGSVTVDLGAGTVTDSNSGTITIADFEQVNGSNHNDVIDGSTLNDWLFGQAGADVINGGGGVDYLIGGSGADILDGGALSDTYYYKNTTELDTITDFSGYFDRIYLGGSQQFLEDIVTRIAPNSLRIDDVANFTTDIEIIEFSDRSSFRIENLGLETPDVASLNQIIGIDLPSDPNDPNDATRNDNELDGTINGDYIDGKAGDDIISASEGDDVVSDSVGYNIIHGGDGNDWISGNGDLYGDDGSDHITGSGLIFGGDGEDFLKGTSASTIIEGGAGNDYFHGDGIFVAGDGIDVIGGSGEIWLEFGSLATSHFDLAENGSLVISLGSVAGSNKVVLLGGEQAFLDSDISFTNGNGYIDTSQVLIGYITDEFDNQIVGGSGNNVFVAAEVQGNNAIESTSGNNSYFFNQDYKGQTFISSAGLETNTEERLFLDGVSSDSQLQLVRDGGLNVVDLYYGSEGRLSLSGSGLSTNFVVDVGAAEYDLENLDLITKGSNKSDIIAGDLNGFSEHDVIYGEYGDDDINGGMGDDIIDGGFGDDQIVGGSGFNIYYDSEGNDTYLTAGNDTLHAGAGENEVNGILSNFALDLTQVGPTSTVYRDLSITANSLDVAIRYDGGSTTFSNYNVATFAPSLSLSDGTNQLLSTIAIESRGSENQDVYSDSYFSLLNPNDLIYAGAGDDIIDLSTGQDEVYGGSGDDTVSVNVLFGTSNTLTAFGEEGADELFGGYHSDILDGGEGNDVLTGWGGDDFLVGGEGDDWYVFEHEFQVDDPNTGATSAISSGENDISDIGGAIDGIVLSTTTDITTVLLGTDGDDLIVYYNNGSVRVADHFEESGDYQVERLGLAATETFYSLENYNSWYSSIFNGGAVIDTLTGNQGDNVLNGLAGNDILDGGAGNDELNGGTGDDTYLFDIGDGTNTITEEAGFDTIELGAGITLGDITFTQVGLDLDIEIASGFVVTDFYSGDADKVVEQILFDDGSTYDLTTLLPPVNNNDFFDATSAVEHHDGGTEGIDTVSYAESAGRVTVDLQNNTGTHNDAAGDTYTSIERVIGSNNGQDSLYGDAGDNILLGLDGSDNLEGGAGADIIDGGDNTDYVRYTRSDAGVDVDLERAVQEDGHAEGDVLINIEHFYGTNFDDIFRGENTYNNVLARGGNDTLEGRGGSDRLYGGSGDDTFIYESGKQQFFEEGAGIDRVEFNAVWAPEDAYVNGDLIIFEEGLNQITFNDITLFEAFAFDGHGDLTLQELINFSGGAPVIDNTPSVDDDTLIGTAVAELLDGGVGNDTVSYAASSGRVTVDLENNTGTHNLAAGDTYASVENVIGTQNGSDYLYGDAGDNYIQALDGNDYLEGGAGADILDGGDGTDYARYIRSNEAVKVDLQIEGSQTNTTGDALGDVLINIEHLYGTAYNDEFIGNQSYNKIYGRNGDDKLSGLGGSDYLYGGNGDDELTGGEGVDLLYGQVGADTFIFKAIYEYSNNDLVQDFRVAEGDKIDISSMLQGYDALTNAITDFVQITDNGTNSYVFVDDDGGADNFIKIATLYGEIGLTDEDALETSGTLITSV